MYDSAHDRPHVATPTRLEQARREGKTPRSYEMMAAMHLVGALLAVLLLLGGIATALFDFTSSHWVESGERLTIDESDIVVKFRSAAQTVGLAALPLLALLLLIGIGSHLIQTGPMFSVGRVKPDSDRLSPRNWFEQMFSLTTLSYPLIGVPKLIIASVVTAGCCWINRQQLVELAGGTVEQWVGNLFRLVLHVSFAVASAMLVLSVLDYLLQRWVHARRLRMTDQQLRDELRSQTIDPQVARQRELTHRSFVEKGAEPEHSEL